MLRTRNLFYFPCLMLLLWPFLMAAQELNQTDASGRREGAWKKLYDNGKTRFEGRFDKGIPTGEFRYYHENGKLRAVVSHAGDGLHATAVLYNEKETLVASGQYHNEQKDGAWLYYNEKDGRVVAVENYDKGKPHGPWKVYFTGDTIVSEIMHYRQGTREGAWIQYFPDGGIKAEASYLEDMLHGAFRAFTPKRGLLMSGNYMKGQREGEWLFYTDDGKLKRKEWYRQGEMYKEEILIPEPTVDDTPLDPSLDPEKSTGFGGN